MYVQKQLAEQDIGTLHALMQAYSFGTLVLPSVEGPEANHLPFELVPSETGLGVLRAHVGVRNPAWQLAAGGQTALVIFQGPHAYISPAYHPADSRRNVAPSWNYCAVHAYGRVTVVRETAWLTTHIMSLTRMNEARRATPWQPSELSDDMLAASGQYIVGLEIAIEKLQGKFQVSQQYPESSRRAIVDAVLREMGPAGEGLARIIRSRRSIRNEVRQSTKA
jgi:transcriptional regulator